MPTGAAPFDLDFSKVVVDTSATAARRHPIEAARSHPSTTHVGPRRDLRLAPTTGASLHDWVIALLIAGVSGVQTERAPQLLMIQTVPSLVDTSAPLPELTRTDSDNVLANFRLLDRLQRPEFPDSAARVLPYRRVDG